MEMNGRRMAGLVADAIMVEGAYDQGNWGFPGGDAPPFLYNEVNMCVRGEECGTSACVAGHAVRIGVRLGLVDRDDRRRVPTVAMGLLGLPNNALFGDHDEQVMPKFLRKYEETGRLDWTLFGYEEDYCGEDFELEDELGVC